MLSYTIREDASLCDPVPSITIVIIPFIAVKDEAFVKAHSAGIHAIDYQPLVVIRIRGTKLGFNVL